jgi:uncharacterized membrane protein YraQ (UPF0718 family)
LKPYRQSGFQNSGEKISSRFAEADRLEAGGFNPLGGKSIRKVDKAVAAFVVVLALVALLDTNQLGPVISFTLKSLAQTAPFIGFAVLSVGFLKAANADAILAKAFEGREVRMIFMAALVGGLSPFCSCEVIPFIPALLAVGAPISAVMAFWLSSPLMDPPMFFITSGALGMDFAIAKTIAAVVIGAGGGLAVKALGFSGYFSNPLRESTSFSTCGPSSLKGQTKWKFWQEAERIGVFKKAVIENVLFLGKWLLLAYLLEAVMLSYIPAELIATALGGEGIQPIFLGALLGGPAYLNGYAAVPLVAGLLEQGMAPGAAMSFIIAGGVSCIPAAIAVWALVKPRIFGAYIGFAFLGSMIAGLAWASFV